MQQKHIAFIPQWIAQVLGRNNLKKEELLSFETISKYLSTEDLVSLVVTGHLSDHFAKGVVHDKMDFVYRWLASTNDAKLKDTINTIAALSVVETTKTEVFNRLCERGSVGNTTAGASGPVTFELSLMGDLGVAVVLKAGFSPLEHAQNSSTLLKQLVKQLYVYEDYHQLMSRPVGLAYVESLMH